MAMRLLGIDVPSKNVDETHGSENLAKFLGQLDVLRKRRAEVKNWIKQTEMVPLMDSLTYRRDLLTSRFAHRIDALVACIQKTRGHINIDWGISENDYTYHLLPYTRVKREHTWDY
jgi:hypothetical protein